jgi:hypothetical protein
LAGFGSSLSREGGAKAPRGSERLELVLAGQLGSSRFAKRTVRLLNLSIGGCCVETSLEVMPETLLVITLPGLAPLSCEVRWLGPGMLGLRFLRPLHPTVVDHLCATRRSAA